ncbi:MAG TPA: DNA polymerase III subunit delta, partial [Planctomycetota bacterium]|nr:DNA polymerase III subunit delta [Planctomycetota bacterium]
IQDNILAYLKEPPQTACLVLEFEKIDQRLKFGQTLKKKGVLIQCNPLKEESWKSKNRLSELAEWIHLRAEHYQKKIHPDAVQMLCELIGNDLQEIDLHLEKISDKFPNKKEIRPEDLKNAVQNTKKVNVFDFLDTIFSENKQKAFAMSCQLFEKGLVGQDGKNISGSTEITLQILRLIHYRIRQLWQIGVSRDTASISDFIQRKMKPQAERFSATRLKYIWQKTLETEIAIKVEQVSPELALEKLLNSICSKNVS